MDVVARGLALVVEHSGGMDRIVFARLIDADLAADYLAGDDPHSSPVDPSPRWVDLYRVAINMVGGDVSQAAHLRGRAWAMDDGVVAIVAAA